jgi:hypothetical protein
VTSHALTVLALLLQGKDHTIFATVVGKLRFKRDNQRARTFVWVEQPAAPALAAASA